MSSSETRISGSIGAAVGEQRLGRLRRLDPTEIWSGSGDLTPWLRSNPGLLGEALRLEVRPSDGEEPESIGELTQGVPVVVKARFEHVSDADLHDLAALVADLDAGVLVLLAPAVPPDARERLGKLNRNTTRAIVFYGVEFELYKIDDSAPAPQFRVVAGPEGWDRAPSQGATQETGNKKLDETLSRGAATATGSAPGEPS